MHIDQELLTTWGGVYKTYEKNEYVFHENEHPRCYYQLVEGCVKMYNTNEEFLVDFQKWREQNFSYVKFKKNKITILIYHKKVMH